MAICSLFWANLSGMICSVTLLQGILNLAQTILTTCSCQNSAIHFGIFLSYWALWITWSWENSDWKGPCAVFSPSSCSKQGKFWNQTRLLSAHALTSWDISEGGNCTTSLDDLVQCLAFLLEKILCLISHLNLSCFNFCMASSPLCT